MHNIERDLSRQTLLFEAALQRARADFVEMPGLRLTLHQARRLWMLDSHQCEAVLDQLVRTRFLTKTNGQLFVRSTG